TVRNRNVLSTVRLGMEVLRRPDYEITTQHLLAAAMALAEQLLKDGYALAVYEGIPQHQVFIQFFYDNLG
ncbi:hypothetical protein L1D05_24505, partial [Vibrio vulnificus]|nr:hypothetical protein [Vibrio vulnificus]